MLRKKKVLIIDGSAFVRQFLKEIFNKSDELTVTAAVNDPNKALDLLKTEEVDVITFDIEMPEIDGLAFLQHIMLHTPKPVIIISSWTQTNSDAAIKALSLGAVDVVAKPVIGYKEGMELLAEEIVLKVKIAAKAKVSPTTLTSPKNLFKEELKRNQLEITSRVIAIGASTGGTVALGKIIKDLKPNIPGMIIIQHMPGMFTDVFAKTLDQEGPLQVKEARDGEQILTGTALIVPGGKNLAVIKKGTKYIVQIGPRVNYSVYNPSIDYTFFSIAAQFGSNAMGVILTGMGDDGAKGLRAMFDHGAYTIAQDEKTSVIFGMPQRAIEYGGVRKVVSVEEIAQLINRWSLLDTK